MSKYTVELVGLPRRPAGVQSVEVELEGKTTLGDLTSALRHALPALAGNVIRLDQHKLTAHCAFNGNGRFHVDQYDVVVQPRDRIVIVALAMGG